MSRTILCHAKHGKEVYYQFEDDVEASVEDVPAPEQSEALPVALTPPPAPTTSPISSSPAAIINNVPIKATDVLTVIVAQKLKKKADEVPLSKSIKDLVGGKSTLQNEILGDLQLEFTSAPEKGEEMPLEELGSALGVGFGGSLGKYSNGLVSRLIGGKMPGGFNSSVIKGYLSKTWGLGPSRADGVLLLGLTMEPTKRLGSEAEAKSWLDGVVSVYAQRSGIPLSAGSISGIGPVGGATINSEEFLKFQAEQEQFAVQQIDLYMHYLKKDPRSGDIAFDKERLFRRHCKLNLTPLLVNMATYISMVFSPLKAQHFNSSWNWVRQDALLMYYDIIFGKLTTVDREVTVQCIAILNRADPEVLTYMQYNIDHCDPTKGENYKLAKEFGQRLINNTREVVGRLPVYKDGMFDIYILLSLTLTFFRSYFPNCSSY